MPQDGGWGDYEENRGYSPITTLRKYSAVLDSTGTQWRNVNRLNQEESEHVGYLFYLRKASGAWKLFQQKSTAGSRAEFEDSSEDGQFPPGLSLATHLLWALNKTIYCIYSFFFFFVSVQI